MVPAEDAGRALTLLEFLREPENGWPRPVEDCLDTLDKFIKEHSQCPSSQTSSDG